MKVYRVRQDVTHYQYFLPADPQRPWVLFGDCKPKLATWEPPEVYIYEPLLTAGDFFTWDSGTIIANARAEEALRGFFQECGESLPLTFEGQPYWVLNVTLCINCLDQERCVWRYTRDGHRGTFPAKYAFHSYRFDESALFKIPETYGGELLLVEGMRDPEDEFRYIVEQEGLRGLEFEELWSDEEG